MKYANLESVVEAAGASDAAHPHCLIVTMMREEGFSGNQVYACALRDYLVRQHWPVSLITPFTGGSLLRSAVFGVRLGLAPFSGTGDVFWFRWGHEHYAELAVRQARKTITGPVVYFAQDPQSARVSLNCRRPGTDRVVLVVHFNESQADEWVTRGRISRGGWLYRQIQSLEREVLPAVDHLIFVSEYMLHILENQIPAVTRIPRSVMPNFAASPSPFSDAPEHDVIAIGTLEPRKNQSYILRVLARLREQGQRVTATMVGDGPSRTAMEKLVHQLDLQGQVIFAGAVKGAANWIPSHRVLVHAAQIENCPITLLEALAAARPIVAAAVGGIPEIITPATGVFWDLSSVDDGAAKLGALLRDESRLALMRKACIERYQQLYCLETAGARLGSILLG